MFAAGRRAATGECWDAQRAPASEKQSQWGQIHIIDK
jgi:hypothetical protein